MYLLITSNIKIVFALLAEVVIFYMQIPILKVGNLGLKKPMTFVRVIFRAY